MSSGERPIGAAKGTQTNAMASCQPPPRPLIGCTCAPQFNKGTAAPSGGRNAGSGAEGVGGQSTRGSASCGDDP